MTVRMLATGLAASRCAFGVGLLWAPAVIGGAWIGSAARDPRVAVAIRALGARDLALGLGALRALRSGDDADARAWCAAQALSDGGDLAVTLLARRALPASGAVAALTAAAGTAAGVVGAATLAPRPRPDS